MKAKQKSEVTESNGLPPLEVADRLEEIERVRIFPDPDQPRKTFSGASLDELALSIMEQGIVQPLVVRLEKAEYRVLEPDLHRNEYRLEQWRDAQWVEIDCCDAKTHKVTDGGVQWLEAYGIKDGARLLSDRYVIVTGERRWRASAPRTIQVEENQRAGEVPEKEIRWRGLDKLPCIVRDVSAHRRFAQQWIENAQRENVSALDEAEALSKQLTARRMEEPGFKAEDLARELGMSRAGLYQRMALLRLHPPVKQALLSGLINMSQASVVAMLPLGTQQEKLLARVTNETDWQYPWSVRDLQEHIEEEYVKQLKDAPFKADWACEDLVTCAACPQRTGNMLETFPELKTRPNVCTNPTCYGAKCKAHWLAVAREQAQAGKTVLTESEFRKVKKEYVDGEKHEYASNKNGTFETLMGRHKPEPVLVATDEGLKAFYKKDEAVEACRKNGVKFHRAQTEADRRKEEQKEKESEAKERRVDDCMLELFPKLLEKLGELKPEKAWAIIVEECRPGRNDLMQIVKKQTNPQALALGKFIVGEGKMWLWNRYSHKFNPNNLDLWKTVGIDFLKEFEKREATAQAALPKPAPEQGKLLEVKANQKKAGRPAKKGK